MTPFDFVNQIMYGKKDLMDEDPQSENEYVPFLTNKSLSYHLDCIMQANEMNMRHHLDKKLQFHYFINNIRNKKRSFQKFVKPELNEQIQAIKTLFECSDVKAYEILRVLTREQLELVKQVTDMGGKQKTS